MPRNPIKAFRDNLKEFSERIPDDFGDLSNVAARELRGLRLQVEELIDSLKGVLIHTDPVAHPGSVFDPGSPAVAARTIASELLARERVPLGNIKPAYGSGVYALYYMGDYPAYERISRTEIPIYVGKADPDVAHAETPQDQGQALVNRLTHHARSIRLAEEHSAATLSLDHFECRFLVVDSAWQSVSETYLIRQYKPIWNKETGICEGFGKHGDSSSTRDNKRSKWDTLHPGRPWADDAQPNALSRSEIVERVRQYAEETYRDL